MTIWNFFEHDWNLWKNNEDQKLENQKLQRKSALLACQTQQLNARRDTLEVNLKELTEQLEALEEFSIEGDKKQLQEMKSLQQVAGDQNSLLEGIFEKMTLGQKSESGIEKMGQSTEARKKALDDLEKKIAEIEKQMPKDSGKDGMLREFMVF